MGNSTRWKRLMEWISKMNKTKILVLLLILSIIINLYLFLGNEINKINDNIDIENIKFKEKKEDKCCICGNKNIILNFGWSKKEHRRFTSFESFVIMNYYICFDCLNNIQESTLDSDFYKKNKKICNYIYKKYLDRRADGAERI